MTKQEITEALKYFSEDFPKDALIEARNKRIEVIPELLEALDYVNSHAEELFDENSEYYLHIYAMYLLAEFREKRAFPKLLAFLRQPEDYIDFIMGDILTDDFARLLCSTFDGENISLLRDVIEDQELYEYARSTALRAYVFLCEEGHVTQEELVSYLRHLIYEKLPNDYSYVPTVIVDIIINMKLIQLLPEGRCLYDRKCVDTYFNGRYDCFLDDMFSNRARREEAHFVDDAVKLMGKWHCFNNEDWEDDSSEDSEEVLEEVSSEYRKALEMDESELMNEITQAIREDVKQSPIVVHKNQKTGRNEPCPCGSGKKYKRCCYEADRVVAAIPSVRLEDKYDLTKDYPMDSPLFKEMFDAEAIEIDMPVYKALHHRAIPMWVERDYQQEKQGKIEYLNEALKLFLEKCQREGITSFKAYDEQYMVHYRSYKWVEALIELTKDDYRQEVKNLHNKALETMEAFG